GERAHGERLVHRLHERTGGEHADLHRIDAHVLDEGLDLRPDDVEGDLVHAGDPPGGLGGERGEYAGAEGAEGAEGLQVGLDPRTARGVRAGDREGDGRSRQGSHGCTVAMWLYRGTPRELGHELRPD